MRVFLSGFINGVAIVTMIGEQTDRTVEDFRPGQIVELVYLEDGCKYTLGMRGVVLDVGLYERMILVALNELSVMAYCRPGSLRIH